MSDDIDDLILGWTMIDLSDPAPKRASVIAENLGISVDQFIDDAIAEKVARWDAEHVVWYQRASRSLCYESKHGVSTLRLSRETNDVPSSSSLP